MIGLNSNDITNSLVRNAISGNRGGGASDIFNSINNRRYGGLFNENTGNGVSDNNKPKVTVSGAGPGGMFHSQYHNRFSSKLIVIINFVFFSIFLKVIQLNHHCIQLTIKMYQITMDRIIIMLQITTTTIIIIINHLLLLLHQLQHKPILKNHLDGQFNKK